jgi:hypothetical protein
MTRQQRWWITNWIAWLWGVGLPTPHVASVLELGAADVAAWECPALSERELRRRLGFRPRGIKSDTGRKVRVLRELGYGVDDAARVLALNPQAVQDYLTRTEGIGGKILAKPRTKREQRSIEKTARRRAARKAAAADRARWMAGWSDPIGLAAAPAPPVADLAVVDPAAVEAPEPTRWSPEARDSDRASHGARHGRATLSWNDVDEIRRLRLVERLTFIELARRYGVTRATISAICRGETWQEAHRPPAPPPAAAESPAPEAPKQAMRWQPMPEDWRLDPTPPLPCPDTGESSHAHGDP